VTIQSGSATTAGVVAGAGGGASGKSAAQAKPDATNSNPIEMGHEADDMTTQLAWIRSDARIVRKSSPKTGLTHSSIAYRPAN
jgi:hypothetical protein